MSMSLRARIFLGFLLLAGVMGAISVLSIHAVQDQVRLQAENGWRLDRMAAALADLRALPVESEGRLLAHLAARNPADKARIAAALVAADTREALALAVLGDLARGPEAELVADLRVQARTGLALRQRVLAISDRNAQGQAVTLATQEMPVLREAVISALRAVGVQSGLGLVAARAEAALNEVAARQKNALLTEESDLALSQMAAAAVARAEFEAEIATLSASEAAGVAALGGLVRDLAALEDRFGALMREDGTQTATDLLRNRIEPLDHQRLDALDGVAALLQTGQRAMDSAAIAAVARFQTLLIVLTDLALVVAFVLLVFGLGRLGRGLEDAVRLAERMAEAEVATSAWVHKTLAGRLTAALVKISTGQMAVVAALDALATGAPLRTDLPEVMRLRLARLDEMRKWEEDARAGPAPDPRPEAVSLDRITALKFRA